MDIFHYHILLVFRIAICSSKAKEVISNEEKTTDEDTLKTMEARSEKWHWTLYFIKTTTWNDAAHFCQDNGGRLLKLDSYSKKVILEDIITDFITDFDLIRYFHIWVGIYYDEKSSKNFWQGVCNDELNSTEFSNWYSRSLETSIERRCAFIANDDFIWRPDFCHINKHIICEVATDDPGTCSQYNRTIQGYPQVCVKAIFDKMTPLPLAYQDELIPIISACDLLHSNASIENTTNKRSSSLSKASTLIETSTRMSTENVSKPETTTIGGGGGLKSVLHTLHSITTDVSSSRQQLRSSSYRDIETTKSTDNTDNTSETAYGVQTLHHTLGTDNTSETTYGVQTLHHTLGTDNTRETTYGVQTLYHTFGTDNTSGTTYDAQTLHTLGTDNTIETTYDVQTFHHTLGTDNIRETTYGVQTLHHTLGTDNTSETTHGVHTLQRTFSTPICKPCECLHISETVNITAKEVKDKIEELKAILSLDRKNTVKSKLKLISAKDDRTSSKTIGYIGLILIIIPIIVIVLFDVSNLIAFLRR